MPLPPDDFLTEPQPIDHDIFAIDQHTNYSAEGRKDEYTTPKNPCISSINSNPSANTLTNQYLSQHPTLAI